MNPRSMSRDACVKALYAQDISKGPLEEGLSLIKRETHFHGKKLDSYTYACVLFRRVNAQRNEIDEIISGLSDWQISRMPTLDRNILRLATCELMTETSTAAGIILSEAGALADKYSTSKSKGFVEALLKNISEYIRGKTNG